MQKNIKIGYLLAFFTGALGFHAFYYKKYLRGVIYFLICLLQFTIPIMVVVGWIDMFFLKKWHSDLEKEHATSLKKGEKPAENNTQVNNKSAFESVLHTRKKPVDISKQSSHEQTQTMNELKNRETKFYREDEHILDKYKDIQTPQYILDGVYTGLSMNSSSNKSGISVRFETQGTYFIKDSYQFKDSYRKGEAREVPLQEYWTTFRDLNDRQREWYLYWRTQVLNKNYLDVDLSYIILFIYELINYSFNSNAAFNLSLMEKIYHEYNSRQPKLKNYAPEWLADMLYELKETELAREWDNQHNKNIPELYLILQDNTPLREVSMKTWNKYIQYGRKSAFFEEHRIKIYHLFKKSIGIFQNYMKENNQSLINQWFDIKEIREVRHPFKSAVMGRVYDSVHIPTTYYEATKKLTEQITAIMKYTENILRQMNDVSYRVKVNEDVLPSELLDKIKKEFLEKDKITKNKKVKDVEQSRVSLNNQERFKEVAHQSAENKDTDDLTGIIPEQPTESLHKGDEKELTTDNYFDETRINKLTIATDELVNIFNQYESVSFSEGEGESTIDFKTDEMDVENKLTTMFVSNAIGEEEYKEFISILNDQEREFIKLFISDSDYFIDNKLASEFTKQYDLMLGVFLSNLNRKADEYLEDVLIESDNDTLIFNEDFTAILDMLEDGVSVEN